MEKGNVFLGAVGALAGAIIGSVLWILIGQVGFIAGIAGYVIVAGSVKGYQFLGKRVSRKGIVMCVIFSVCVILAAAYLSLGITIYRELKDDYWITLSESIKLVPDLLGDSEVRNEFLLNLAVGYGLAIFASFSFVKSLWFQTGTFGANPTVGQTHAGQNYTNWDYTESNYTESKNTESNNTESNYTDPHYTEPTYTDPNYAEQDSEQRD